MGTVCQPHHINRNGNNIDGNNLHNINSLSNSKDPNLINSEEIKLELSTVLNDEKYFSKDDFMYYHDILQGE